jgi:hypothetical protein
MAQVTMVPSEESEERVDAASLRAHCCYSECAFGFGFGFGRGGGGDGRSDLREWVGDDPA